MVPGTVASADGPPFFAEDPLTFNTRQERLHQLAAGDRLWLVSRRPEDGQYYFVAALRIAGLVRNPPGGDKATRFGEYAIVADRPRVRHRGPTCTDPARSSASTPLACHRRAE